MLGGDKGCRPFPRTPFSASGALPPLRSGQVSLDEDEHFLHNRSASVATLRELFAFGPECRSRSLRNQRSPSPESALTNTNPSRNGAGPIDRCHAEIAAIEALLLAGHPDVEGLCMALSDWSAELRLVESEQAHGSRSRGREASSDVKAISRE